MEKSLRLSRSLEDYLEVIFKLIKKNGAARITEIAEAMDVAASSVNEMVAKLKKRDLVEQQKYGPVRLTPKGKSLAAKIDCTHEIIFEFLHKGLGVDKLTADQDACLMEHSISEKTLLKIIDFLSRENIISENENCLLEYYEKSSIFLDAESDQEKIITLANLSAGERAEIKRIEGKSRIKRRLMDMGLNTGAELVVKGKAPMGDPIEIKVRNYNLTLRRDEAEKVKVKVVKK